MQMCGRSFKCGHESAGGGGEVEEVLGWEKF